MNIEREVKRMDKEKLIKQIMKECADDGESVTREEAEEMAEMEIKAKKDCRRYEVDTTKERKTATREKKVDEEKLRLVELLNYCLLEPSAVDDDLPFRIENVSVVNDQKEIVFNVGENDYSLTLTRHRKKK
jgi:hypothetical protein